MEADLPQSPDILFNYTEDDLRNPTVVKNSYTKTITLGSTNANDRIFGSFFDTQFKVNVGGFNPTKKLPFQLFLNGDLVHEGYARLDNIQDNKGLYKYTLTLFGGLGDFFYELTYDNDEGGKKSLADLHYMSGSTSADEFDFTINKNTVANAWETMRMTESEAAANVHNLRKWKYINFMPAYEGLPDDFDTDKALINFRDSALVSGITSGTGDATSAYTTFDGYALAELSREHTGNEMREFRSYLQRPCLNVRKTIEAICKPENNGGYEVDLDSHFFNEDNPYWTDTWMTLPLLNSFETVPDEITGTTLSLSGVTYGGIYRPDRYYWQENTLVTGGTALSSDNMYAVQASFTLQWNKVKQAYANLTSTYPLDFCMYDDDNFYQASCMIMQLVAYNSNGQIVSGGKAVNLTSSFGHGGIDYPTPDNMGFVLPWGKEYENNIGTWEGGYNRTYSNAINLSIDNVPAGATVKLVMRKYNLIGPDTIGGDLNICLCGQRVDTTEYTNDWLFYSWLVPEYEPIVVTMTDYNIEAMNSDVVRSGSHFKKRNILSTSYSPADFLLSYGKMFGLYFSKDRYEKKIYIRDRDTYYTEEIENVHDLIDRSTVTVKPVFVGTKWLDFKTEAEESQDVQKYKEVYGIEYGLQRTNTGYDFNADITDLFKDSIFKGGIPALEKSECYSYFDDDKYKPWMLEGYSYDLYLSGNTSETTAVTYGEQTTIGVLQGFHGSLLKYYDLYEGLQFHDEDNSPVDGSNILVFYNGNLQVEDAVEGTSLRYWITDDTPEMMVLNNNKPCWLWTLTSLDSTTGVIAILVGEYTTYGIPLFSRYKYFDGTYGIRKSLDFGTPKQLFNPLASVGYDKSDIYTQFWKDFVGDLYSPDTRVVTANVLLDEISEEDMRKWWWFDNSIWRLNKVTEYNVAAYKPTTLEFVKVQDTDNYKLTYDNSSSLLLLSSPYSTATGYTIPSGETEQMYVEVHTISPNAHWNVVENDKVTVSPSSGIGDSTFYFNTVDSSVSGNFSISVKSDVGLADIDFYKNNGSMYTVVLIPQAGNVITNASQSIRIAVWASNSYNNHSRCVGDAVSSPNSGQAVWIRNNIINEGSSINLNTDFIEFGVPANTTGEQVKWTVTITAGNTRQILYFYQEA